MNTNGMGPVKAPTLYRGVQVPDTLGNNWDTLEAHWWRSGVDLAKAGQEPPIMSTLTIAELRARQAELTLEAQRTEDRRLSLQTMNSRLRAIKERDRRTARALEYKALAEWAEGWA